MVRSLALGALLVLAGCSAPNPEPAPQPGGPVLPGKELFVIDEVVRNAPQARRGGAWHVRSALQRIAGGGEDVDAFARAWFEQWATATSVPGADDVFAARPWVRDELAAAWAGDRIQLLAIVNRIDLTRFGNGIDQPPTRLGEGRFVYEVRDASGASLPFTLIFEYGLPTTGGVPLQTELARWAAQWRGLGHPSLGGPSTFGVDYLAALERVTGEFSAHGALRQIRTNEFLRPPTGSRVWELREFRFDAAATRLHGAPVVLTPADSHHDAPRQLVDWIRRDEAAILDGKHALPGALQGAVASVPSPSFSWAEVSGAAIRAGFIVSFNTCNGCHAGDTGTPFQHIGANTAGGLGPFLKGRISLPQPLPPLGNADPTHDEMAERARLLEVFAEPQEARMLGGREEVDALAAMLKRRAARPH